MHSGLFYVEGIFNINISSMWEIITSQGSTELTALYSVSDSLLWWILKLRRFSKAVTPSWRPWGCFSFCYKLYMINCGLTFLPLVYLSFWKMILSKSLHSVMQLEGVLFWSISYFSSLLMKGVRYGTYRFRCLNLSNFFLSCTYSMSKICIVCLFTILSVNEQIYLCTFMQAPWAHVSSCRWWLCNLHSPYDFKP